MPPRPRPTSTRNNQKLMALKAIRNAPRPGLSKMASPQGGRYPKWPPPSGANIRNAPPQGIGTLGGGPNKAHQSQLRGSRGGCRELIGHKMTSP